MLSCWVLLACHLTAINPPETSATNEPKMALFSSSRVSHRSPIPTISMAEEDLELEEDGSESSDPFGGIIVNSRPRYGKRNGDRIPDHFLRSSGHFLWNAGHFPGHKSGHSDGGHFSGHSTGEETDQKLDPVLIQAVAEKSSLPMDRVFSMRPSSKSSGVESSKSGHKVSRASSAKDDRKLQLCRSCLLMEGKGILKREFLASRRQKIAR